MAGHISIKDECGVIRHLQKLASTDFGCEHCAVAIADEADAGCRIYSYCMVQEVGGETNSNFSILPRKVSYALLHLCRKKKAVPVILHTHIMGYEYADPLGFSPQDEEFAERFIMTAKRMGNIPGCAFIVMNGAELDELEEVMAGGCGCRDAACAGACSGKGQTSKE